MQSWAIFTTLLVTVLGGLWVLWLNPSTGYGDEFLHAIESFSPNSEVRPCLNIYKAWKERHVELG
jgi:hypothetical protein